MADARPNGSIASGRALRWLAGFVPGAIAGPLVLYVVLQGLQPASILELTVVTDANEPVRVAEASFAGWPLTIEYAADGAVRFHHEPTRRKSGTLRLAVEADGVRHALVREIDLKPKPDPLYFDMFRYWEMARIPRAVPVCHIAARASASALEASLCLEHFYY